MNDLVLTFAGLDYFDRVVPLIDGTVKPAGIALRHIFVPPSELFRRVAQHAEFDLAEMSSSTYMNLVSRGDTRHVAIPVFLSRKFRYRDSYAFEQGLSTRRLQPEELFAVETLDVAPYQSR